MKVKTFCLAYVKSFVSASVNGGGIFAIISQKTRLVEDN